MVAELVDEDVVGERGVRGAGRLTVEDAAAAVLRSLTRISTNSYGACGGDVAQRALS